MLLSDLMTCKAAAGRFPVIPDDPGTQHLSSAATYRTMLGPVDKWRTLLQDGMGWLEAREMEKRLGRSPRR